MGRLFDDEGVMDGEPRELEAGFMNRLYDRVTQPQEELPEYERRSNTQTQQDDEQQDNLREAVNHVITLHATELKRRLAEAQPVETRARNQMISDMIVALPYREAIAMGEGIAAKLKGPENELSSEILTRAIQAWAWENGIVKDE
jgi:hypothetical protein